MLDQFHLPTPYGNSNVQIFNNPVPVTNLEWHTWLKPRGVTMLHIMCLGGGGGGGGGFSAAASAARGGGGGGGSSAIATVLIPAFYLPDRLYIQVGAGGLGVGSGGGAAGNGVLSYVSIYPDTAVTNVICYSGASGAGGGGTGTGAAVGAAGAAGTAATAANMPFAGLGNRNLNAGQVGVAGGAVAGAAGGTAQIPATGCPTMGGAGGGGTTSADFQGGPIGSIANSWLSEQRAAQPAAGSFNGSDGFVIWKPFFSFCGCGGSSSNAGVGGVGGNGGYGSGGGGGGGGTTGGRGGDGGSGIVIMVAW